MESENRVNTDETTGSWRERAELAGAVIRSNDRWRTVRTLTHNGVRTALPDGRVVVQFASNDYFGLSAHPAVIDASIDATKRWGTGAGASRLVVGSRPIHDELESALADWKATDAALLFPTGYAANLGVLCAIARLGIADHGSIGFVSDELNHASLIDGVRLTKASLSIYPHADVEAAAEEIAANAEAGRRSVIVTDSVFSMDGDVAPLLDLARLAAATGSLLVVDDAHAVLPGHGADVLQLADHGAEVLVVGTLSKSLGSLGGFVAGSGPIVDWCRNTARPFIFSTATPPAVAAAALAALGVLRGPEGSELIDRLRANIDVLVPDHRSGVIPVILGAEEEALRVSAALLERGLLVPAIRPPTVAAGSSRLRIAVSAAHTSEDLTRLVDALSELTRGLVDPPFGAPS